MTDGQDGARHDFRTLRAGTYYNKGLILSKIGRHAEAVECYDRAIEIRPDYAAVYRRKGLALSGLGRHVEAAACYAKAATLKP